jgi:carbon storage regulator CsrA
MLALTRKPQEGFVIASSVDLQELVRVTVVEVCGARVKLEIQTSSDLTVHREEVWERVCGEKKAIAPAQDAKPPKYQVPYTT